MADTSSQRPATERPQGMSMMHVFAAVMIVASFAAGCVLMTMRRRGHSSALHIAREGQWAYRRVTDLSGRGAMRYDPHMAVRLEGARMRARRGRGHGKGRGGGRGRGRMFAALSGKSGNADRLEWFPAIGQGRGVLRNYVASMAASAAALTRNDNGACYSLQKNVCDLEPIMPTSSPPPAASAGSAASSSCVFPAADHLDAASSSSICGVRLPRRNPCWCDH